MEVVVLAAEIVVLAAERVVAVVVAATGEVAAPTTPVEEAVVREATATATRQGLGHVVEHPDTVRAVVLGDPAGEMEAAARGVVKVNAGMAREVVPKTAHSSSSTVGSSVDQGEVMVGAGKGKWPLPWWIFLPLPSA